MTGRKTKGKIDRHLALGGVNRVPAPSRAIRDVRIAKGLSLRALSARAGLPYSTLSKLENGKMSLTYDKLIRLAQALNVDLKDILANPEERAASVAVGRRSITRAGEALDAESEKHVHHYPASDLLGKMMIPIIIDVQARSVDELGGLVRHGGEEYLYVLRGSMELHSDIYAPLLLGPGDSVYFDSGMAHGYVRTSNEPCTVLAVCAGQGIQQLAETARMRLSLSEQGAERD
jgi:transcriptional regulator with XRE-family HTH domain